MDPRELKEIMSQGAIRPETARDREERRVLAEDLAVSPVKGAPLPQRVLINLLLNRPPPTRYTAKHQRSRFISFRPHRRPKRQQVRAFRWEMMPLRQANLATRAPAFPCRVL